MTGNASGSRWKILYKKTEMKMHNPSYVIMASVMLHNFCIHTNDPCNPRWKLCVIELKLNVENINRQHN